ncbi:MAG TPA: UDP-N-acetylmuramate--L-alanine ligase, partial [Gemmatirosa sp.]
MPLLLTTDPRPVHFVGIAGAGMSALAELFVRRGATVTGCDAHPETASDLRALGVAIAAGHNPAHVAGARAIVVTSAVPRTHPELQAARDAGVPVIRRAEALAEAVAGGLTIGIAGTHGKTTTTVMTTEALAAAGLDPTGIVGGRVGAWSGNLRLGNLDGGGHERFVVEADEYDRSFLALTPGVAVVTNVEADHLDIYADLADIRAAFTEFVGRARLVVLCADDAGATTLPTRADSEVVRYSAAAAGGDTHPDARLFARDVRATAAGGSACEVVWDGRTLGTLALAVPGLHNVRNALAALAVGLLLGAEFAALRPGLEAFGGVERRFERLGEVAGVLVIDDYAHHPTELDATLAAARVAYPGRRIVAAFQPHLYTRTRDFAPEFARALATADVALVADVYPAREQPIAGVSADLVSDAMRAGGKPAAWRGSRDALASALVDRVRPGDVVLTIGAGDVTRTGPELLAAL